MFRGDEDEPGLELIAESLGRDFKERSAPVLGMEARSILKSIETETQKLQQFDTLARTDRHYFRARFNYYKLSILRLRADERTHLEPHIGKFFDLIMEKELASDAVPEVVHTPFLEPVRPTSSQPIASPPMGAPPFRTPNPSELKPSQIPERYVSRAPSGETRIQQLLNEILHELQLLKLALKAPPSHDGNRFMADEVQRILDKISG